MGCLETPTVPNKKLLKRGKKINELRQFLLTDKSDAAEFTRASIGIHYRQAGLGKKAMLGAFNQWISDVTHFNMNDAVGIPSGSDIAKLTWLVDRSIRKYDGAMKEANKILQRKGIDGNINKAIEYAEKHGKLVSNLRKWIPFTKEAHYSDKLPSKELLDNVIQIKQRAENRKLEDGANIKEIVLMMDKMAGTSTKKASRKLSEIEGKIANYEDRLETLRQMRRDKNMTPKFEAEASAIMKDQRELSTQREVMLSDLAAHPANAIGSRLIEIIEKDTLVGRKIAGDKLAQEALISKKDVTATVEMIRNIFVNYADVIGPNTADKSRKVLDLHMERLGFSEDDRAQMMKKFTFEPYGDGYFPKISVAMNDGLFIQDWINKLEAQAEGHVDLKFTKGEMNLAIADFSQERKAVGEISGRNRDVVDVILQYTQQMSHADYVAGVSYEIEKGISTVWDLAKSSNNEAFMVYLEMFKNEVEIIRRDAMGTTDHGIMASLSRASHALFAAGMLGAWNVGGIIRNVGEGSIVLGSKIGLTAIHRSDAISKKNKTELADHDKGERIDFASDELWRDMVESPDLQTRIVDKFGEDIAYESFNVMKEHDSDVKRYAKALEKGTGWLATTLMSMGWTPGENIPRRKSHKVGSALGFQDAKDRILPNFQLGVVPQITINKYNLDGDAVRSGDPELWMPEYKKVEKEMTNVGGYRMVAGSQWIYDAILRHAIESFKPGGAQLGKHAAMFMHYSYSFNTAKYLAMQEFFGRIRAGGLKDGASGTTEESEYSTTRFSFNRSGAFLASIMGMSLMGMVLKDEKFGNKSGFRMFGFMNEDTMNLAKDFYDFNSKDPDIKKRAFFGRGIPSTIGGPPVAIMVDSFNTMAIEAGLSFEDFPEQIRDVLRLGGVHPQDYKRTEGVTRQEEGIAYLSRMIPFVNKGLPFLDGLEDGYTASLQNAARLLFSASPHYKKSEDDILTPEQQRKKDIQDEWEDQVKESSKRGT